VKISNLRCRISNLLRNRTCRRHAAVKTALNGLALFLGLASLSQPVQSQTLVARTRVSYSSGINISPHLAPLPNGNFAAVWGYAVNSDQPPIPYGRVIKPDGKLVTPVRKNLITAILYPYQRFVAGPTAGGRVLVVGTRTSDSRLVVRALDANLKAIGGQAVARYSGYSPILLAGKTTGAILGYYSADTSEIAQLDESGRFASDPTALTQSSVNFVIDSLAVVPKGYLALGRELKSGKTRATGVAVPSDLSAPGTVIAYENSSWPYDNNFRTFGAFLGESGLAVFGHRVNPSTTAGYRRTLLSTGKPKGAPKKYPSNIKAAVFFKVIPLTGTDKFAVCYLNGYVNGCLQILDKSGVPVGSPVPAAATDYSINLEYPGIAWNEASSTLAIAYSIYSATPDPHYELWIALYKLKAEE